MLFGFVSLVFFLLLHDSKSDTKINMYNTFFITELKLVIHNLSYKFKVEIVVEMIILI